MSEVWAWLLHGAVWMPFLGALIHPPMAWLFQKGGQSGLGMGLTVGVSNLLTAAIFLAFLRPDWSEPFSSLDALALFNGVFFFGGQWFAVKAVKAGDLVVHSSALGMKLIFVAAISATIGLELFSGVLLLAVLLSFLGVFLLAGGDLAGWRRHSTTVGLTMVGTLLFAVSDILTANFAQQIGTERWLHLMMAGSAVLSMGLLVPQRELLVKACKHSHSLKILLGLGVLMGVQAILVNLAFGRYREPTVSNVVFALRGLLAIPFLMLVKKTFSGVVTPKAFVGAGLILGSLVLAAFVG